MKMGLITDIHERVEPLRRALDHFRQVSVDQVIMIGDVFARGEWIEETCRLLHDAGAVGVWGNHDYGLCVDVPADLCVRYAGGVIDYMATLRPRLEIGGCHFQHVEPWLNPEELTDLWYYGGSPDEAGTLDRIFAATPFRIAFAGHYHKWLLASPRGIEDWRGDRPIALNEGRYYVVIGALCEGRYAVFDTDTSELVPFNER